MSTNVVDTPSYIVRENDKFIEVNYTTTGDCIIIIPNDQIKLGRQLEISDTGSNADIYHIYVYDDESNLLFIINENNHSISIKANIDENSWYVY